MNELVFNLNEVYGAISVIHACKATYKEALDAKIAGAVPGYGISDNSEGYITDYNGYIHWIPKEEFESMVFPIIVKENYIPSNSPEVLKCKCDENDTDVVLLKVKVKTFKFNPNEDITDLLP